MTTRLPVENAAASTMHDELRVEAALCRLPPSLQLLNRIYVRSVARRSLLSAVEASTWLNRDVTVFLRHDKVSVFAVVCGQCVAMADFVTLENAAFHVNTVGREQSNAGDGPLPNTRTIHAWLTGRLLRIADHGKMPDVDSWQAILYHPVECDSFVRDIDRMPIEFADVVELVPGKQKVWCPRATHQQLLASPHQGHSS